VLTATLRQRNREKVRIAPVDAQHVHVLVAAHVAHFERRGALRAALVGNPDRNELAP